MREIYDQWEHLLDADGKINVMIRSDVFTSEEAVVDIFAHEVHELKGLEMMFDEVGKMSAARVKGAISTASMQNLHYQAWDMGDLRVLIMRAKESGNAAEQARLLQAIATLELDFEKKALAYAKSGTWPREVR